ncbi:MAG: tRNA (adenosine(37)-N6)-threonylcarbamoyltransferase complex ATPase subunit type 1 TsaE [bacterium]|nr:tRNA (adenosine(37)-N6)-threonylcarbamoyltransferase complex ATPase subunit type 1 TsaE [bacterium]
MGKSLQGGELISLTGPLGSGKTVLARGIARGLAIDGPIRSPSFNLMREYHGRLILRHWDLYRLDSGFESLGLVESVSDDSVVIVEWAERWCGLDKFCTLNVNLNYGDSETNRVIRMTGDLFIK